MERERIQEVQNFINVLEEKEINMKAEDYKIVNGDIVSISENTVLDLYVMDEAELADLQQELATYVVDYLKEQYLNQEIKLLDLDNNLQELIPQADSIFDGDTRDYIENSFCYQYLTEPSLSGFNFEFEIIEDSNKITDIIVKIINIDNI
jgi:Asp-tRNA(Asn)/Glu-tRNA(Gln) amidotransferase B subunit